MRSNSFGKFYHYTSLESLKKITQEKTLKPSTDINIDAAAGMGLYFTDLPPNTSDNILNQILWIRPADEKLEVCLKFSIDKSIMKFYRDNCYVFNTFKDIDIGVEYNDFKLIDIIYRTNKNNSSFEKAKKALFNIAAGLGIGYLLYKLFIDKK